MYYCNMRRTMYIVYAHNNIICTGSWECTYIYINVLVSYMYIITIKGVYTLKHLAYTKQCCIIIEFKVHKDGNSTVNGSRYLPGGRKSVSTPP